MATTETYNGWTNYETWAVKLWMDNDQVDYEYWREHTNAYMADDSLRVYDLAAELKQTHEDLLPDLNGFASDLLNASFSMVNWYEIAESLIQDYEEEHAN